MNNRRADIIEKLERGAGETIAFFKALSPAELSVRVYDEEVQWTGRQVLAHFITIEGSMQRLFKNILAGGPGTPEDFDLERFNRTQPAKLDGLSIDELIDRFTIVRRETVAIVEKMEEADFDRTGRHVFLGNGNLERFVRWAYKHARHHEDDVRNALKMNND